MAQKLPNRRNPRSRRQKSERLKEKTGLVTGMSASSTAAIVSASLMAIAMAIKSPMAIANTSPTAIAMAIKNATAAEEVEVAAETTTAEMVRASKGPTKIKEAIVIETIKAATDSTKDHATKPSRPTRWTSTPTTACSTAETRSSSGS